MQTRKTYSPDVMPQIFPDLTRADNNKQTAPFLTSFSPVARLAHSPTSWGAITNLPIAINVVLIYRKGYVVLETMCFLTLGLGVPWLTDHNVFPVHVKYIKGETMIWRNFMFKIQRFFSEWHAKYFSTKMPLKKLGDTWTDSTPALCF